jgi:urease accessory protein UreE
MVTHSYTTITGTQPLITLAQAKTVQSGDDLVYEDDLNLV